ncbi:hypothetical protein E0Z10_g8509 [Xylaria hypoxylon]|uniref:Uncharacterized protein n=1 Tax=Xylaria hypoxylon TaxID=37992 RepID=A0A4Z0YJG9_9PEZI|nr:hypothetical protein E0Z10_g8509 [Xylaria hypoxylon]
MTSILWPDVVYKRRAKILVADEEAANVDHLYIEGVNHKSSRETIYRTCAIELLADVLGSLEHPQSDGIGNTVQRPQCVLSKRELPNWVRCPDLLYATLDERVIEMIKNVNDSKDEPDWKLDITPHERAQIIRAHIQRRFNRRVIAAVERRRPMGALFCFFDPNFTANLRPLLQKELNSRHETHSSTWNQANGVWMMVECALIEVFEDCEEHEEKETGHAQGDFGRYG